MSMPLILLSVNTLLHIGSFLIISIGFASPQWAIYTQSCGCSNDCFFYIGLLTYKYTKIGGCDSIKKDTTCDTFALTSNDCDRYTAARQAGKLACLQCKYWGIN